jgi:hypothetical protein
VSKVVIVAVDLLGHSKRQVKMGGRGFNSSQNVTLGEDVAIFYNFKSTEETEI